MTFVAELEPRNLWSHFDRLLAIPRASGHEEGARHYVVDVARRAGREVVADVAGNVVVRKPASAGAASARTVILQSHLDMVPEKRPDVRHDFSRDPIVPRREGDYLHATGTTLGADNGMGVAAMLAVLEATEMTHPPLELVFTVDEERGLTGAGKLDPALLTGRTLLSLDSEEDGFLYVGCAGGGDSVLTLPTATEPVPPGHVALRIAVQGLRGGHSGMDIVLQRGNALLLLARALRAGGVAAGDEWRLSALEGGGARNAIPRDAAATVTVASGRRSVFTRAIEDEFAKAKAEHRAADPEAAIGVEPAAMPSAAWAPASGATLLRMLLALPNGVLAMSLDLRGLVETSSNVAVVRGRDGGVEVVTSQRSSVGSALAAARDRVRAVAELAGATAAQPPAYPGWRPDMASPLLVMMRELHRDVLGSAPEVRAVHAGLECGVIGEKIPGTDMISFGPQIEAPHSPDERVHIPSVERFYRLLTAALARLATSP
ncbi:MAG TPA: aminoacyl-histidine dipeptidase [Gemmatimonadales bacterium]